jgi:DNA-binding response OmpR family regulator
LAVDILIAEDEPSILESLDFILRRAGWSISSVTDGDAVLGTLRRSPASSRSSAASSVSLPS